MLSTAQGSLRSFTSESATSPCPLFKRLSKCQSVLSTAIHSYNRVWIDQSTSVSSVRATKRAQSSECPNHHMCNTFSDSPHSRAPRRHLVVGELISFQMCQSQDRRAGTNDRPSLWARVLRPCRVGPVIVTSLLFIICDSESKYRDSQGSFLVRIVSPP